ncbi:ras GEF [Atractiella rhizophila]|nr:ras GEF [Atractiella rhizophila]
MQSDGCSTCLSSVSHAHNPRPLITPTSPLLPSNQSRSDRRPQVPPLLLGHHDTFGTPTSSVTPSRPPLPSHTYTTPPSHPLPRYPIPSSDFGGTLFSSRDRDRDRERDREERDRDRRLSGYGSRFSSSSGGGSGSGERSRTKSSLGGRKSATLPLFGGSGTGSAPESPRVERAELKGNGNGNGSLRRRGTEREDEEKEMIITPTPTPPNPPSSLSRFESKDSQLSSTPSTSASVSGAGTGRPASLKSAKSVSSTTKQFEPRINQSQLPAVPPMLLEYLARDPKAAAGSSSSSNGSVTPATAAAGAGGGSQPMSLSSSRASAVVAEKERERVGSNASDRDRVASAAAVGGGVSGVTRGSGGEGLPNIPPYSPIKLAYQNEGQSASVESKAPAPVGRKSKGSLREASTNSTSNSNGSGSGNVLKRIPPPSLGSLSSLGSVTSKEKEKERERETVASKLSFDLLTSHSHANVGSSTGTGVGTGVDSESPTSYIRTSVSFDSRPTSNHIPSLSQPLPLTQPQLQTQCQSQALCQTRTQTQTQSQNEDSELDSKRLSTTSYLTAPSPTTAQPPKRPLPPMRATQSVPLVSGNKIETGTGKEEESDEEEEEVGKGWLARESFTFDVDAGATEDEDEEEGEEDDAGEGEVAEGARLAERFLERSISEGIAFDPTGAKARLVKNQPNSASLGNLQMGGRGGEKGGRKESEKESEKEKEKDVFFTPPSTATGTGAGTGTPNAPSPLAPVAITKRPTSRGRSVSDTLLSSGLPSSLGVSPPSRSPSVSKQPKRNNAGSKKGSKGFEEENSKYILPAFAVGSSREGRDPPPVRQKMIDGVLTNVDLVVAVVGPRGVGKSTVIKKGVKRWVGQPTVLQEDEDGSKSACLSIFKDFLLVRNCHADFPSLLWAKVMSITSLMPLQGHNRIVEVLEIDMSMLSYTDQGVVWPDNLPQLDGAMICYDATDPRAIHTLATLLHSFWTRGKEVPMIVLACKSPTDPALNKTDPLKAAEACNVFGTGIVMLDGGVEDPQKKMSQSFKWIIKTILQNRGNIHRPGSSASVSVHRQQQFSPDSSRPTSPDTTVTMKHSWTSSSGGGSKKKRLPPSSPPSESSDLKSIGDVDSDREKEGGGERESVVIARLAAVEEGTADEEEVEPEKEEGGEDDDTAESTEEGKVGFEAQMATGAPPEVGASSLPDPAALSQAGDMYFDKKIIIDKFLHASVTGNDVQYTVCFIICFRKFTTPYHVLSALLERFKMVTMRMGTDPVLSRFVQMKLCDCLHFWISNYPGDFSGPSTFRMLKTFLTRIFNEGITHVIHYALSIFPFLPYVKRLSDPESSWGLPDFIEPDDFPNDDMFSSGPPRKQSATSLATTEVSVSSSPLQGHGSGSGSLTHLTVPSTSNADASAQSSRVSNATPGTTPKPPFVGNRDRSASDAPTYDTQSSDRSKRGFSMMRSETLNMMDIANYILDVPEDAIAEQISRLTWMSFENIKPRDLIRYVLAPSDPRDPKAVLRDKHGPVQRSFDFTNYLSDWAISLIISQSKLKQRTRMLEKVISLAYALRARDNFDALMGILMGLGSQPVFRLSQTWDLVKPKPIHKKYLSLKRLMGSQKAFAAYRLALSVSDEQVVPYLGVHLQDITTINELKSDMRDGQVNWTKFHQMAKAAAVVVDCERNAPNLPIDERLERLIQGAPVYNVDSPKNLVKPKPIHKKYLSLKRLMGSQKAFAAYRLALSVSDEQVVPYLGVHLQDITTINELKSDMRDGQVNWTKFHQMAKAAAVVVDCERNAPNLPIDERLERLIQGAPVYNVDDQYSLSYTLEPKKLTRTTSKNKLRKFLENAISA